MELASITPVLLCFNEQDNLPRTLSALRAFPRVVIVDSGSTDASRAIAREFGNVQWFERPFDQHAAQWQHALSRSETDWVLSLDADYVLPEPLLAEIATLDPHAASVFQIGFRFFVHGAPLSATLLPPRAMLFRRSQARYVQDGHTQVLHYEGHAPLLRERAEHDDRKPLTRWLWAQIRYVQLEADKLLAADPQMLDRADRLRRHLFVMPWLAPAYILIGKGLLRDGWRGWHYALSRALVELMLSLTLIDRRFRCKPDGRKPEPPP
ncbi:glycosyl transferase [Ahniella affigens]|uniref:Glycosyl transferase n=1 Tax=Ahniella affigens TaxID=2021234 RepID=A0A2P1PYF0_9GAMM|nr:glycosyltransferase family 2 protein [Ahniella affigens]AVP99872.1 glycosyl transferase [Ahniella affigens]